MLVLWTRKILTLVIQIIGVVTIVFYKKGGLMGEGDIAVCVKMGYNEQR